MKLLQRVLWFLVALVLCIEGGAYVTKTLYARQLPTRLLQQADLIHQGSFRLPDVQDTGGRSCFDWTNGQIAFNPTNNSLFVVGHAHGLNIGEITIPAVGGVATMRQNCANALESRWGEVNPSDPNQKIIGGLWVEGTKLIMTVYSYYDGGGTALYSHFVRSTTLSAGGTLQGPFKVGTTGYPGTFAGYFTPVPAAWQAGLGETLLNGTCCHAIAGLWSFGPSIGAVDPADLLAITNPTPATKLLHYPQANAPWGYCEGTSSTMYNGTTEITGAVLPTNTASLLFFGRHGLGNCNYVSGGGPEAPPYQPQVWAFNVNALVTVAAGSQQPYQPLPYATFKLPGLTAPTIGGVATDPATGRIFVSENMGDGTKMKIHIFTISGATAPAPVPPTVDTTAPSPVVASATPSSLTVGSQTTLSATASDDYGVMGVRFFANAGQGDVEVGIEDISSPYSVTFAPTTAAVYVVTAKARDAAGNVGTSAGINVTVTGGLPNVPPPPTPSPGTTGQVTTTITSCRYVAFVPAAPTGYSLGSVQFQRSSNGGVTWNNVGNKDAVAPYERSATLSIQAYQFRQRWTATGLPLLTLPLTVSGPCAIGQ